MVSPSILLSDENVQDGKISAVVIAPPFAVIEDGMCLIRCGISQTSEVRLKVQLIWRLGWLIGLTRGCPETVGRPTF